MEIKGTIIAVLPEVSGVSKTGNPWKKREYVLENTESQYPRKVAFTCFGDNADKIQLSVGQVVTMYFDIESREWQGKWFTDIRCWRCDVENTAGPVNQTNHTQMQTAGTPVPPPPVPDDIPF